VPLDSEDDRAIAALVAAREAAWNAGDAAAYRELLTEDADILSATGRPARGRDAFLALFLEQHHGAFAGTRTRLTLRHLRYLREDVALADVDYLMEGGMIDRAATGPHRGLMAWVVRKDAGAWRIAGIRSIPAR
jgi:uncharacterized protein (TIGR02246 family)